jgi:ubiquinone/menaquinone biosynthesis C-methylase UbiE
VTDRTATTYGRRAVGAAYDAMNLLIWMPTGSGNVRRGLVDALQVRPGSSVLELGCGTGQVTELLLDAGADVTAVDRSEAMMSRARRRAPAARFELGDVLDQAPGAGFDIVVLAFVLHELPQPARLVLLEIARKALGDGGRLGILEWALPPGRVKRSLWRWFVRTLEPAPALEVLDGSLANELAASSWVVDQRVPLAGRRAEVTLASRASTLDRGGD